MKNFTPKEIVSELDKYIVGQNDAKRAVAIALRNRWRRKQVDKSLQKEIVPKNILMIGPTGVGKTEIARRLANLDNAPFVKVEATKFTEVGYVGRDVEQIIRDLVEISIQLQKNKLKSSVTAQAEVISIGKIVDIFAGKMSSQETKDTFKRKIQSGELDDKEIEIEIKEKGNSAPMFEMPGGIGQMGMISLDNILGKQKKVKKKVTVAKAKELLMDEVSNDLIDNDELTQLAIENAENNGIVFIDEIDKIASSASNKRADVSREGVQRDLLPLVEGTVVATKHGSVKTDYMLFITSGAFHISKPSDLLPELQGRLPIRVELSPLTKEDFKRILTEPEFNLIKQYKELLKTENIVLEFSEDAIEEISSLTNHFNETVENIGARRLHTMLEKLLEDINFMASEKETKTIIIDKQFVMEKLGNISIQKDLSKYII